MLLELTLYLLIGFAGLMLFKARSIKEIKKDVVFVLGWPIILLYKYVVFVDEVKKNNRRM